MVIFSDGVLCCFRSTGLYLILTGLALLKHPPPVSSLPRADPLCLVQSWRPLSPLKQIWPYPCLIHDTVTCSDSCEQHWQPDRFLRVAKGNQLYAAVHTSHTSLSLSHIHTFPYVTLTALKCIGFMSSLTCGQLAYKSRRSSGGVLTTH